MLRYNGSEFKHWSNPLIVRYLEHVHTVFVGDKKVYPEPEYRYKLRFSFRRDETEINDQYGSGTYTGVHYDYTEQVLLEADFPIGLISLSQSYGNDYIVIPPCGVTFSQYYTGAAWRDRSSVNYQFRDYQIKSRCRIAYSRGGTITRNNNGTIRTYQQRQAESGKRVWCMKNPEALNGALQYLQFKWSNNYLNINGFGALYYGNVRPNGDISLNNYHGSRSDSDPTLGYNYSISYNNSFTVLENNNPQYSSARDYAMDILTNDEWKQQGSG